jgi:hypothetical protein
VQHNFDVQIQRSNPEIARYSLSINKGAYDPEFFVQGVHRYSLSPGGLDAQARPYQGSETESDEFTGSLSGLLPTGLTYQLSGRASDQYGTRPDVILGGRTEFENATANAAAATLTQPLLRNFWIDAPRANIYISKNRLKYSEQALRFLMQTVMPWAYWVDLCARKCEGQAAVLSAGVSFRKQKRRLKWEQWRSMGKRRSAGFGQAQLSTWAANNRRMFSRTSLPTSTPNGTT